MNKKKDSRNSTLSVLEISKTRRGFGLYFNLMYLAMKNSWTTFWAVSYKSLKIIALGKAILTYQLVFASNWRLQAKFIQENKSYHRQYIFTDSDWLWSCVSSDWNNRWDPANMLENVSRLIIMVPPPRPQSSMAVRASWSPCNISISISQLKKKYKSSFLGTFHDRMTVTLRWGLQY